MRLPLRKRASLAGALLIFMLHLLIPAGRAQDRAHPLPELASRLGRSVWKISFQLGYDRNAPAFARYAPFSKLPYAGEAVLTKYVLDRIVGVVVPETKAAKVRLMYGPGGYKHFPLSPSAQLDVLGTHEDVIALEEAIGYLARQNEVIASQVQPSGGKPAFQIVQIRGQNLHDPAFLQRFWNRLGELSPTLQQGFLPLKQNGQPGIRIINTEKPWAETDYPDFDRTISTLEQEFHTRLATQRLRVNFDSVENAWKTHPDGSEYLRKLREQGYGSLADRLVRTYQPRVDRWLLIGFARYSHASERALRFPSARVRQAAPLHAPTVLLTASGSNLKSGNRRGN